MDLIFFHFYLATTTAALAPLPLSALPPQRLSAIQAICSQFSPLAFKIIFWWIVVWIVLPYTHAHQPAIRCHQHILLAPHSAPAPAPALALAPALAPAPAVSNTLAQWQ